jgi:chromate reductase
MTTDVVRVLGVVGSLRKGSFNRALMDAVVEIAKAEAPGLAFTIAEIDDIPLYNEDVRSQGYPAGAQRFRDQIAAAQALLFVSPEYNYSVPGVLKNAIDWGSRPPNQPFSQKPFGVMGASGGMGGTARMQYHLRQIAVFLDMHPLNQPEIFLRSAKSLFSDDLKLTDQATRDAITKYVKAYEAWCRRFSK